MSSINWSRIEKLADVIEAMPSRKIEMGCVLSGPAPDTKSALSHHCKSAGCIEGWAVALFARKRRIPKGDGLNGDSTQVLGKLLGISSEESSHIYWGQFSRRGTDSGKREVVAYLRKAIAEKDIMVTI